MIGTLSYGERRLESSLSSSSSSSPLSHRSEPVISTTTNNNPNNYHHGTPQPSTGWELWLHPCMETMRLPMFRNLASTGSESVAAPNFSNAESVSSSTSWWEKQQKQEHSAPQRQSYRIAAQDITHIRAREEEQRQYERGRRRIVEFRVGSTPNGVVWQIECSTRNSHDLLLACLLASSPLSSRSGKNKGEVVVVMDSNDPHRSGRVELPPPPTVTSLNSNDGEEEDDVDSLTDRCIRDSARRESLREKLERRWRKAIDDFREIMITTGC